MTTIQADKMKPARGIGGLREKDSPSHRLDYSKSQVSAPPFVEPTTEERREHFLAIIRIHRLHAAWFTAQLDFIGHGLKAGLVPMSEAEAFLSDLLGQEVT